MHIEQSRSSHTIHNETFEVKFYLNLAAAIHIGEIIYNFIAFLERLFEIFILKKTLLTKIDEHMMIFNFQTSKDPGKHMLMFLSLYYDKV